MIITDLSKFQLYMGGINVYYYNLDDDKPIKRVTVKNMDHFNELLSDTYKQQLGDNITSKIILECSTKGDKRFSAFGARVTAYKVNDAIEFHYQLAKTFEGVSRPDTTSDWNSKMEYTRLVKKMQKEGKSPTSMVLGSKEYDVKYLQQWYDMLWCKYLDMNPEYVEYLRLFDDFNDIFKGKSKSCQADSIRKYIKQGRDKLLDDCSELIGLLTKK